MCDKTIIGMLNDERRILIGCARDTLCLMKRSLIAENFLTVGQDLGWVSCSVVRTKRIDIDVFENQLALFVQKLGNTSRNSRDKALGRVVFHQSCVGVFPDVEVVIFLFGPGLKVRWFAVAYPDNFYP